MIDANAVRHLDTAYATPGTAGVPSVDTILWKTKTIPTANVDGVPLTDQKYSLGTILATPSVAGIPKTEASGGTVATVTTVTGGATSAAQTTAQTSLTDLQGRVPAALDGGFMKAQIKGVDTDALTAASVKADAATKIGAAVWAATGEVSTQGTHSMGDLQRLQVGMHAGPVDYSTDDFPYKSLNGAKTRATVTMDADDNRASVVVGDLT